MNSISNFQKQAADEIIESFEQLRWVMLSAQMQSGKTDTFYLVAFEMLRRGLIQHVVVLCGASDRELKRQNSDRRPFICKYRKYLGNIINDENSIDNIISNIDDDSLFTYVFNHDMKVNMNIYKNTLFIWDESHYAQSLGQVPTAFLTRNGISGNGNYDSLASNSNFMLSVSATNFSEKKNMIELNQNKKEVILETDSNYCGVKTMSENNQIQFFGNVDVFLNTALKRHQHEKKYAIIRFHSYTRKNIECIKNYGYKVIIYNNKHSKNCPIKSLDELNKEPTAPTVIIIQNMCRMGKRVPKDYISFVMETSFDPKTDTLLQGLLGRMCGYHNRRDIMIYLHFNNHVRNELSVYINHFIPTKAKNIISGKEFFRYSTNEVNEIMSTYISNKDILLDIIYDKMNKNEKYIEYKSHGTPISSKILCDLKKDMNIKYILSGTKSLIAGAVMVRKIFW